MGRGGIEIDPQEGKNIQCKIMVKCIYSNKRAAKEVGNYHPS